MLSKTGKAEKIFKGIEYYNDLEKFGVDLSLNRMRALLKVFDDPHLKVRTILVGGTNGKGSVVTYLSSILAEAGFKCGRYLSPHIFSIDERISIGDENISIEVLDSMFREIRDICISNRLDITQFEAITALSYVYFHRKEVDIAVMEVGMGGRLDATNVADPILSIITNVSLDHTEYLGSNVEEIAFEKLGILRNGSIAVIGQYPEMAGYEYLLNRCDEVTSTCLINGRDMAINNCKSRDFYYSFDLDMTGDNSRNLQLHPMKYIVVRGPRYQVFNASMVAVAVQVLNGRFGFNISEKVVRSTFKNKQIQARFQFLSEEPLVILDCAHNRAGIDELCESIEKLSGHIGEKDIFQNRTGLQRKVNWICSFMEDKDIAGMLRRISGVATNVYISELPLKRSATRRILAMEAAKSYENEKRPFSRDMNERTQRIKNFNVFSEPRDAVRAALINTTANDILVIAGSIYSLSIYYNILKEYLPEIENST